MCRGGVVLGWDGVVVVFEKVTTGVVAEVEAEGFGDAKSELLHCVDLRCGRGVGEAEEFTCFVEFPVGVGGGEDAAGAWVCGGAVVHDACEGSGGGESDGIDGRRGVGEEGLADGAQVTMWVECDGEEDHVSLEEVVDDGFSVYGACSVG